LEESEANHQNPRISLASLNKPACVSKKGRRSRSNKTDPSRVQLFSSIVGLIVGGWLIVPRRHSRVVHGLPALMEIIVYVFVAGIIMFLMTSLRTARALAQNHAAVATKKKRQLEVEIQQRMQTEAALRQSEALLEKRLHERTAELQEMVDELKRSSYALLHDMRAPLRSIRSFAEIIEEESRAAARIESRISVANPNRLQQNGSACNSLLSFSKAVVENLPLHPVDPSKLLRELCATYSNLQPHLANIRVEGFLPPVLGNDAALTQCFSILLSNSVKFAPPGVTPQVRVWADQIAGFARISVRDNGIGILATQRHLFGIFQPHTSGQDGTGIGLAIVRKLT
jgi:signal transduction histidine kinase